MKHVGKAILIVMLTCASGYCQGTPEGAWKYVTAGHGEPITDTYRGFGANALHRTNILVVSALSSAGAGQFTCVNESGSVRWTSGAYNWAEQGYGEYQLSKTNMAQLQSLLHDLAATTNSTPIYATNIASLKAAIEAQTNEGSQVTIARFVMVSFHDGTNWIMRQFVDNALPRTLYKINDTIYSGDRRYYGMRLRGTYPY